MMQTYNKIETVFNRDIEGTKRLILDSYRNETVEYLKDNIWQFTEKIDGTNIRIHWDGHNVEFGGRTDKAHIPNHTMCIIYTYNINRYDKRKFMV